MPLGFLCLFVPNRDLLHFFFLSPTAKCQNFNMTKCRTKTRRSGLGSLAAPPHPSGLGSRACLPRSRAPTISVSLHGTASPGGRGGILHRSHLLLQSPGLGGHTALARPGVSSSRLCVSSQRFQIELSTWTPAPKGAQDFTRGLSPGTGCPFD